MNNNLAIIGASYLQLPLIKKAKEMGFITHVFAWKCGDVGEKEADYFYPISIIEKDQILSVCKELNICGICSIASDLAMLTVNYVANHLKLCSNSLDCTEKTTNKHLMRKCFEENKDPSPKSYLINDFEEIAEINIKYPIIIKPTDRSGSRGIYKVNRSEELKNAYENALKESFEKKVLLEEYVEGNEYSVEYISYKGRHTFLALTKKFTTGSPHFIEKGHMEPADVSLDILNKIKKIIEHALTSLGVEYGASHSEIKINSDGQIKIIEIGARMGGDCIGSHLVRYSTGYDFVKMVIQVACGIKPTFEKGNIISPIYVKFILSDNDLEEYFENKANDKLIETIFIDENAIGKATDSSNRAGCYIHRL